MSRIKITEFQAKKILLSEMGAPFASFKLEKNSLSQDLSLIPAGNKYVVKVDEGVKGRMKKGLVKLNVDKKDLGKVFDEFEKKGYGRAIVEPMTPHDEKDQRFLSLTRTREGITIFYSKSGGIDIESNKESVKEDILTTESAPKIAKYLGCSVKLLQTIQIMFDKYQAAFLEINPLLSIDGQDVLLDLAVEVDSAGIFFTRDAWPAHEIVASGKSKTPQEVNVSELASKSQAAFSLTVLNPDGSLGMLLSGGGASLVLADEAYNLKKGHLILNYGEYSGNPNEQETHIYTTEILSLVLASIAPKKALIIAGGVANFTDIRITFRGIIGAIGEHVAAIKKQDIKVFVRRGGPYAAEGLNELKNFLDTHQIKNDIHGPELPLHHIIHKALEFVK